MIKLFFLILFLSFINSIYAQEKYSENEVSAFIKVYFKEKEIAKFDEKELSEIFEKYNITLKTYNNLRSQNIIRSKDEDLSLLRLELVKHQNQYEVLKEEKIKSLCQNHSISIIKYYKIKNLFQNDLKFHRALKTNIDNYIKTINND